MLSISSMPKCAMATASIGMPLLPAMRTMSGALDSEARSASARAKGSGAPICSSSALRAARAAAAAGPRLRSSVEETAAIPALKVATVSVREPAVNFALRMNQASCDSTTSCTLR